MQYSGGLETISKYLQLPEWDEQTIEERANELYEQAKQCGKISNVTNISHSKCRGYCKV